VSEHPGGVVLNAESARKLERGDAVLGLGKVVNPAKPDRQRQLGSMENSTGGDGRLMAARRTLVEARTSRHF